MKQAEATMHGSAGAGGAQMTTRTMLLVDRTVEGRDQLAAMLAGEDFVVRQASNCEEALEIALSERIRVIVSDTDLPTKSGLFLLKEIKTVAPDTEVVLTTSHASSFNLLQALRTGAYDVLIKPIDSGEFLANVVRRAFEHTELKQINSGLIRELEEKNRQLTKSVEMMKLLTSSVERFAATMEVSTLLKELFHSAMEGIGAQKGLLALRNGGSGAYGVKISAGIPSIVCHRWYRTMDEGLVLKIVRRGNPVMVYDQIPERLRSLMNPSEASEVFASPGMFAIPLRHNDRMIGVLVLSGSEDRLPFTEQDAEFLTQLTRHACFALDKTGIIHQLRQGLKETPARP